MEKENLLLEKLKNYSASDMYPFHMPGHKRNIKKICFPDPISIDITEIDGFDNLHHPEGILKESMEWASKVYGSDKTYYLVNGSSCGIMSAVCACVKRGGKILVSRNCHKSVFFGIMLNEMKKIDIYPQIVETTGITGGILSKNVENILKNDADIEAVLIVSPTYDGVVSDVRSIAEVVHKYGIPLIVDEAHGAHFSFYHKYYDVFPASALDCGADLVIQSLHKTLPSMTQTSVLHAKKGLINFAKLEKYLQMFQSSSPSYVLMASIENCIYQMSTNGERWIKEFYNKVVDLRSSLSQLKNIRILDKSICDQEDIYDLDISKMVVSVRGCSNRIYITDEYGKEAESCNEKNVADGMWLAEILRRDYQIEVEMAGADYVLLILTCFDSEEGFNRLKDAFIKIDQLLYSDEQNASIVDYIWQENDKIMELDEASNEQLESIMLSQSAGRISGEFVYLYPPGIPIIMPGEMISDAAVRKIEEYKSKHFPVQGLQDIMAEKIQVVKVRR